MLDLTLAILVRNPPIERLVQQIDYMSSVASEVIIVDTGSTDEELQAMAALNRAPFGLPKVKMIRRPWRDDFAWARNEGLPHITRKWTLHLDPDELPNLAMMNHIKYVLEHTDHPKDMCVIPEETLGFQHFSVNYFNGIREPEQEFHWHVRLFRSGAGRWYRPLDELVSLGGLPEHETRGTPRLPKAPKEAYFIHSKSADAIDKSEVLYRRLAQNNKG